MSEVLIPPWIIPEEEPQDSLDEGSSVFQAAFAPGLAQRQSYGGLRLKLSRKHTVRGEEKARLLSILKSTKGRYNALRTKVHFAFRGSFQAQELLTNGTFSNGTTGWALNTGTEVTLSSSDRVLRGTRTGNANSRIVVPTSAATVVQYAPYVARAMVLQGRGTLRHDVRVGATAGLNEYGSTAQSSSQELVTLLSVPYGTSAFFGLTDWASTKTAGDYFESTFLSYARCMVVDNSPNALLHSDSFDNAAWTKAQSTITANSTTGPDGTSTADSLIEAAVTSAHYALQAATKTAAAQDWCGAVFAKANTRTQVALQIGEASTNFARVIINLSDGSVASAATNAGTVTNPRAYVKSMGDGWYYIAMVANVPATITTTNSFLVMLASGGSTSYAGDGTSGIYVIRGGYAQSSLPFKVGQTTTTSAASGTSQTGTALNLKGLPASTNSLLLPDDIFEINGEIKTCTAALNSDAAQLGYLQFESAMVRAPADNDPVIITDPMGRFLMSNLKIENEFGTQAVVTYDLEHIYE